MDTEKKRNNFLKKVSQWLEASVPTKKHLQTHLKICYIVCVNMYN